MLEKVGLEFELQRQLGTFGGFKELPLFAMAPAGRSGRLGRACGYEEREVFASRPQAIPERELVGVRVAGKPPWTFDEALYLRIEFELERKDQVRQLRDTRASASHFWGVEGVDVFVPHLFGTQFACGVRKRAARSLFGVGSHAAFSQMEGAQGMGTEALSAAPTLGARGKPNGSWSLLSGVEHEGDVAAHGAGAELPVDRIIGVPSGNSRPSSRMRCLRCDDNGGTVLAGPPTLGTSKASSDRTRGAFLLARGTMAFCEPVLVWTSFALNVRWDGTSARPLDGCV